MGFHFKGSSSTSRTTFRAHPPGSFCRLDRLWLRGANRMMNGRGEADSALFDAIMALCRCRAGASLAG